MNWLKLALSVLFACASIWGFGSLANADSMMNSADFTWKYEFAGATANTPDNLDIDGNSSPDMMQWGSAGTVASGELTLGSNASYIDDYGWKPALANGIWKASTMSAANGFTIEARIKVVSDTGLYGATSIASGPEPHASVPNAADGWLCIGGSVMRWTPDVVAPMDTSNNTDDYHVFRMALNPATNAYDIWRDGAKVGSNLPDIYSPSYGGLNRFYIGDLSGGTDGTTQWDYLRFTEGYFAPIPEPSVIVLMSSCLIGLLAYAWRKRK